MKPEIKTLLALEILLSEFVTGCGKTSILIQPSRLPQSSSTPSALISDTPVPTEPILIPLPTLTPTAIFQPKPELPTPQLKQEIIPTPETFPRVLPNDIIGQFITTGQTRLTDGTVVPAQTLVRVIVKEDGTHFYMQMKTSEIYYNNGSIIPPWLSPDIKYKYVVSGDGKFVKGGPIIASESTYSLIRHFDLPQGAFTGTPMASSLGYVAMAKNYTELDIGEGLYEGHGSHHGGTAWKAPPGLTILDGAFGIYNHSGDLLLNLKNKKGITELYWLVNLIPDFSENTKAACSTASHPLNHCEMEIIRNEDGKQRSPNQKLSLKKVPNSEGISNAVLIWNQYP